MRVRSHARQLCQRIAAAAHGKFARDIVIVDVRRISGVADYQVVMSAQSHPQLEAIRRVIEEEAARAQRTCLRWEGGRGSSWIVFDFGHVVVHCMLEEKRQL